MIKNELNTKFINFLSSMVILTIVLISCKKWNLDKVIPFIDSFEVESVGQNSVNLSCVVEGDESSIPVTERGFAVRSVYEAYYSYHRVSGSFDNMSAEIKDLRPSNDYKSKAYLVLNIDTFYSEELSFTTESADVEFDYLTISNVTATSAYFSSGLSLSVTNSSILKKGVIVGLSEQLNSDTIVLVELTSGAYIQESIDGLLPNQTYFAKAFVELESGLLFSETKSFTTADGSVTFSSVNVSSITSTSASFYANINVETGTPAVTEKGFVFSINSNPTTNDNKVEELSSSSYLSESVTGLSSSTTYFVRAYAINSQGTFYSNQVSFTTSDGSVDWSTLSVGYITTTSARITGSFTLSSGAPSVTEKGFVYSQYSNPTINDDKQEELMSGSYLNETLSNLIPGTTYYVRGYATNSIGTFYSDQETFTTEVNLNTPPTLTSPSNNSDVPCCYLSLSWTELDNVDYYIVQGSTNNSFSGGTVSWPGISGIGLNSSGAVMQSNESSNSLFLNTGTSSSNGTYYWRVKAVYDDGSETDWSDVWSFTYSY